MKHTIFFWVALLCFSIATHAQQEIPSAEPGQQYGKPISGEGAISVEKLETFLEADTAYIGKVTAEVIAVCQKKGCFMEVKREGDKDPIMVRFKDYGFFMPQDIVGRTVVVDGRAWVKETSVASLKHYAEDKGKSAEEIAQITEPKEDIAIIAEGVVVIR